MPLPRNDYLYCSHLCENAQDVSDIAGFRVRNPETGRGLEEYLKQQAMPDEKHHLMRTYLVRHCETHELVGYFSLKAGLISCDETKQQDAILFNTIPGVELANFAVNECFVAKTGIRGIGKTIFSELILPLVREEAKNIGIFLIYIFALPYPHLLKAYQNYGFSRLKAEQEKQLHTRLKPRYDKACIFMFYPLHSIDNPQH